MPSRINKASLPPNLYGLLSPIFSNNYTGLVHDRAIPPFFFRLASNAFSEIGSVGRIEKKKT